MRRRGRFGGRWAVGGLVSAALLGFGSPAQAAITLVEKEIDREGVEVRDSNFFPFAISKSDCEANAILIFPLTLENAANSVIEVWIVEGASVDCSLGDNRQGDSQKCTSIASADTDTAENNYLEFRIEAQTIAGALEGIEGCDDSQTSKDRREVAMYFLQTEDPGEDVPPENQALWTETDVDMVGPPAPTNVSAVGGEESMVLEWEQSEGEDVEGYRIYCAPTSSPPSGTGGASSSSTATGAGGATAGAGGAGVGGDATGGAAAATGGAATGGTDTGGSSAETSSSTGVIDPDCYTETLKPGEIPTISPSGSAGQTDNGEASGLTNGGTYACGVAAVDILGNVGPLSELSCGVPEPVDDFFELYRKYGGQAGGGFCDCGTPGVPRQGGALALAGVAFAAALLIRRRRRLQGSDRGDR